MGLLWKGQQYGDTEEAVGCAEPVWAKVSDRVSRVSPEGKRCDEAAWEAVLEANLAVSAGRKKVLDKGPPW